MQRTNIPFGDIVEALGAIDTVPLEKSENWEFYKVRYQTPAGFLIANYLSLAYGCPLQEATQKNLNKWRDLTGPTSTYTAIITANSPLGADLDKTTKQFRARSTTTTRDLLYQNVLSVFMPRLGSVNPGQYFVEPDIALPSSETRPALTYIVADLLANRNTSSDQVCADVLVAPAGLGNVRQQLNISAARQMQIFEELFRDSSDDISRSDLAFYVQYTVPDVAKDVLLSACPKTY